MSKGAFRGGSSYEPRSPAKRRERRVPGNAGGLLEFLLALLVVIIAVFGIVRPFIVETFYVPTRSMVPTLEVGEWVLANKFIYRFTEPDRGQVIVFRVNDPDGQEVVLVKRVLGLPGDEIALRDGMLLLDGVPQREPYLNPKAPDDSDFGPTKVPPGHFFVMGDNRAHSTDSRVFGPVPEGNIVGEVFLRAWPPNRVGLL